MVAAQGSLGMSRQVFFDDLDAEVQAAFDNAVTALSAEGAVITEFDLPEAQERAVLFPPIVGSEIINALTAEGFQKSADTIDPVTSARAAIGLEVKAHQCIDAQKRVLKLQAIAADKCRDFDAWISPTCLMLPPTLDEMASSDTVNARALLSSRNTQPVNLFGMCAVSLPLPATGLPIGFQIMMPDSSDNRLLAMTQAVQMCIGQPSTTDLTGFSSS